MYIQGSHYSTLVPLLKELIDRGHEVVLLRLSSCWHRSLNELMETGKFWNIVIEDEGTVIGDFM